MASDRLYCDVEGCEPPVGGHGRDVCSSHMKQLQRNGRTQPITEKLSLEERAILAGNALVEAGDNEDEYEAARKVFIQACRTLGQRASREVIKEALAAARGRGVRLGRPPKVDMKKLRELMKLKPPQLVALQLGVSQSTVYRARRSLGDRVAKTRIMTKRTAASQQTTG